MPSAASDVYVSVIFPAYQEAEYLEAAVRDVVAGLKRRGRSFEVVCVENGSSDGTRELAQRLDGEIPEVRGLWIDEANYGLALRHGLLNAYGTYVANFDVDLYDLAFLDAAIERMGEPGDASRPAIVVASKRGEGSNDTRHWSRKLVTGVFSTALRVGFGLKVSDTHGMKAMRRADVVELARICKTGTDLFDTELVLRTERSGQKTAEIGVKIEETRPARTPIASRIVRSVKGLGFLWLQFRKEAKRS